MTRTADRAATGGIVLVEGQNTTDPKLRRWAAQLNKTIRESIPFWPVIVADNVAHYLRETDQTHGITLEQFPCLIPPWPSQWIESCRIQPGSRQRQAFHVTRFDMRDSPEIRGNTFIPGAIEDAKENGAEDDDMRFAVLLIDYVEVDKKVAGPLAAMAIILNERGRHLGNRWYWMAGDDDGLAGDRMLISMFTALQTIAFLHCRNVVTDMVRPDPKVARAFQRRHGRQPVDYRTVRLQVPRKIAASLPGGAASQGGRALHIAAGHMAHYGNCCPGDHEPNGLLFGKLEGIYWVPDHLRGDPDYGRTVRDYEPVVKETP